MADNNKLSKKQIEARQVFAKYCVKTENGCDCAGAQLLSDDGKQYVGNAYWIARYTKRVDGLKIANRYRNYSKFINDAATAWKTPFCLDDIRVCDNDMFCTIGDNMYNLNAVKKILNSFKAPYEIGIVSDMFKALYISDAQGNDAMVLPLRSASK